MRQIPTLRKLAQYLLTTTCLTVAVGATAMASTINLTEGAQETYPGAVLPLGTTTVNGAVSFSDGNNGDFFEFQGLTGGESFNALGLAIDSISGNDVSYSLYSDSPGPETLLQGPTDVPVGTTVDPTGTVPLDGNLFVEIAPNNESLSTYSVSIATSSVPEPGTLITLGIGLTAIGGIGLRRRKKD